MPPSATAGTVPWTCGGRGSSKESKSKKESKIVVVLPAAAGFKINRDLLLVTHSSLF